MDTTYFSMDPTPSVNYMDHTNRTLDKDPDLSLIGIREAFRTWKPDLWEVTKVTLLCFTMFMSVVGNSIVITVSRRLFQQSSVLGSIITSLALSHLFFGLTVPLHLGAVVIPNFLNLPELCVAYHASVMFFVTLTLVHLILLAVDRMVALSHPLRFHHVLKPWHMTILLTLGWIYAASTAGALLLWQLNWIPNSSCFPEVHFGLVYRVVHLAQYGLSVLIVMTMLIHVYFNSCKKRRLRRALQYGRRRRKTTDYSLRRNKLFTETGITMATLFFGVCGPLVAVDVIHIVSDRTSLTTAVEKIGVLVVLVHTFFNSLVLPWKIRSFRHRCVYCLCPCTENKGSDDDNSEEDHHEKIRRVSVRHLATNGELPNHTPGRKSSTDTLSKSQTESLGKVSRNSNIPIPNIVITDYDSQKRIALRSDGKLNIVDKDGNKSLELIDRDGTLNGEMIWSTLESNKPMYYDGTSVNSMYLLEPIDGDYPDLCREDEV